MDQHLPARGRTRPLATARAARRALVRGLAAGLAVVVLAGGLSGCGVRLESPPPAEPVPDATEQVRRTAVADALHVAERAEAAGAAKLPRRVAAELERVAADAHAQADALGGVYVSGVSPAEPTSPSPTPSPRAAKPGDVVVALEDAAGRNRTAATTTSGGDLARLLASIGAAQTVSAGRLSRLAGVPGPDPVSPVVPAPEADSKAGSPSPPSPSAPDDVATTEPGEQSDVPPEGLRAADYRALTAAEDGARYVLEVRAARADGDLRRRLLARSRTHGERGAAWAVLGGIAGTAQDPRRVAYSVPAARDDASAVRAIERGLATDYASLVGTTAEGTRGVLVDLVVEGAVTLDGWGEPPSSFPGMPDLAD
jgi:hypothetical protein